MVLFQIEEHVAQRRLDTLTIMNRSGKLGYGNWAADSGNFKGMGNECLSYKPVLGLMKGSLGSI